VSSETESTGRLDRRLRIEQLSSYWLTAGGYFVIGLFALIVLLLIYESLPVLSEFSLVAMLTSANWDPGQNQFGFLPAIVSGPYMSPS